MLDGTAIHSYVQYWLAYGFEPPPGRLGDAARALVPHLPQPGTVPIKQIELRFKVPPSLLGVPAPTRGIVDLLLVEPKGLIVGDHKTRSNLKWALAGDELANDFQIRLYATIIARAIGWKGPVIVRHYNVTRSKPHKVLVVDAKLTPRDIDRAHAHIRRTFGHMAFVAGLPIEQVCWNFRACDDYISHTNPDGCEHRHRCLALGRDVGGELAHWYGSKAS
jgi:hypothetical protein